MKIYDYLDPAAFMRDKLEEKKAKNPNFSMRSWAKQLGLKSHGPLHAMLGGKRDIPKNLVPKLLKSLSLGEREGKYFETLIDYQRAKTIEERAFYQERLSAISPRPLAKVEDLESYRYLVSPLHIIISELTELKDFKNNLGWIKQRLQFHPSLPDIEEVLERLIHLGILKKEGEALKKQVQYIYTTKEVQSKAIQLYHKRMCQLAMDLIEHQDIADRELNSMTFNIKKSDLPKMKEALREFTLQMLKTYESKSGEGEETYHLNVHFFPLSGK